MITPDQQNIKVHFAGGENEAFSRILSHFGGIKYSLFSPIYFVGPKLGVTPKSMKTTRVESVKFLESVNRHVIMDSGIFSLMFGSSSSPETRTEDFLEKYYDLLIQFVKDIEFQGTVVEMDVQNVLSPEKAWEFRKRLAKDLPNNRQINVFHFEDGQEGLDRLIEFSDYIALSVPELKGLKKEDYTVNLAKYIKRRKPEMDIHLLGCSSRNLLKKCNFCTSADSTNWLQVNKFGQLNYSDYKKSHKTKAGNIPLHLKKKRYGNKLEELIKDFYDLPVKEKIYDYYSNIALSAELHKKQYAQIAGNQD